MIGPVVKSFRDKRTEHPEPERRLEQSNWLSKTWLRVLNYWLV